MEKKNYSKEQKELWKEKREEKEKEAREKIENLLAAFQEDPEVTLEYLRFSSRFPNYSLRNTMLIYDQNPNACFVQSFQAWKTKENANVKKGMHGMNIWVPVKVTYLLVGSEYVQLKSATKEQKEAYKRGEIQSKQVTRFRIGTVFDISQTDYPKEKYPEIFQMGYESEKHKDLCRAIEKYCETELGIPVSYHEMDSISLRGYYSPYSKEIHVNILLEDTDRLSTLTHELGHALARHQIGDEKTTAQKEYEGDCISVLIQEQMGLEIPEGRVRHFKNHYDVMRDEQQENHELKMEELFSSVFQIYAEAEKAMQPYIEAVLKIPEQEMSKQMTEKSKKQAAKEHSGKAL